MRYNLLHAPLFSFFSQPFYDDVARRWRVAPWVYLFLLLMLSWSAIWAFIWVGTKAAWPEIQQIIDQVPEITIEDGKASVDEPQPYEITDEAGTVIAVIDTTGETTSLEELGDDTLVLLTETHLYHRQPNQVKIEVVPLKDVKSFALSATKIDGWIVDYAPMFGVVGWLSTVLVGFLYRVLWVLVFGAFAMGRRKRSATRRGCGSRSWRPATSSSWTPS